MSDNELEPQVNPVMHLIAPVAAFAATATVRKLLGVGYRMATGHDAPEPHDPKVRLRNAIMWAVVTSVTAAVVEVAIYRATNEAGKRYS